MLTQNKAPEIISLDDESTPASEPAVESLPGSDHPWAPFQSYADYIFVSRKVKRRSPNSEIDEDLKDLHEGAYSSDCLVSFRNHRDMDKALATARVANTHTVEIDVSGNEFGGKYSLDVELRDTWEIMKRWITDKSLAPVSTWFSQERYLCLDGVIDYSEPLYDEPCTTDTWREIDNSLPDDPECPSCFLGLHIWLDKGLVSTKVKMHPILVRPCWVHSTTRNGSGNGGSTLVGFVTMPPQITHIDPKNLKSAARSEYDRLKRHIYHSVCRLVLASLQQRSYNGEALRFGDGVIRCAYPGVLIQSMDFEELAAWLGIRNSRANHPCPQCLVHHDELHQLTNTFPLRTTESMSRALSCAPNAPKTARNDYLKSYGLHDFKHFLWNFNNSDPYRASGYDCLHYFDGGIWGRHVWPLLKEYLQEHCLASVFNNNMSQFPRWPGLAHLDSPTTIDFSDAETFWTILKCALPCLVQLLPANSCLVRAVRVMQKIRIMVGLEVTIKSRLDQTRELISEYGEICQVIRRELGKDFNFLKQHSLSHALNDIRTKGTSRNMNTRVGEGFQQEVSAMYQKTNGKRAEHQARFIFLDENEETMAHLDMEVAMWLRSQNAVDPEENLLPPPSVASGHWTLGSPERRLSSHRCEFLRDNNTEFRNFDMRLREYIARYHPAFGLRREDDIEIEPCKTLYLNFQSTVDWKEGRDVLRCNAKFHGRKRYDSVMYAANDDPMAMGRLEFLFRCHLPDRRTIDLALVRPYRASNWSPRTRTDCPIREWQPARAGHCKATFVALEHTVRGALVCPIFGAPREVFYLIDCIDADMFLRIHKIK
ncbi:hypothetical protein B0H14DRAFT_2389551 [Mycena olivaceomarginata]|nr:hypothetical protein B0H14DRAFT_2389551 [Mycena olivaceomarginata]